jgi:hypothetical protein
MCSLKPVDSSVDIGCAGRFVDCKEWKLNSLLTLTIRLRKNTFYMGF